MNKNQPGTANKGPGVTPSNYAPRNESAPSPSPATGRPSGQSQSSKRGKQG